MGKSSVQETHVSVEVTRLKDSSNDGWKFITGGVLLAFGPLVAAVALVPGYSQVLLNKVGEGFMRGLVYLPVVAELTPWIGLLFIAYGSVKLMGFKGEASVQVVESGK